jgi:glycosyltransferase involved in cell wall biosynthesis
MKLLFYNHTGQVSGAERMLLMILARLNQSLFDPLLICPEAGPLMKMATGLRVPVESVPGLEARFTWRPGRLLRYLKSFFLVIRELRRKIEQVEPDLIHANSIRAGLVATAATIGMRTSVVWHLHDLLPRHPLSTCVRIVALLCARTRMIAVSQAVASNFVGAFHSLRKRTTVILNAIELERFQASHPAGQKVRDELNLGDSRPIVGIVGQLTPRKGQLELIRSFAQVLVKSPKAVLLVVGAPLFNRDHEYEQRLRATARELGIAEHIRFLGARNDVAGVMQALDLLVVNSTSEPFGLVALEAMACGTPVVAAARDGLGEIIQHGEDGWLVPPGDEKALATAIVNLDRQPGLKAKMAEQGRKQVASRFSANRYLEELQAFYCYGNLVEVGSESKFEKESRLTDATKFVKLAEQ